MPDSVSQMRLRFDKAEVLDDGGTTRRVRVTVSYAGQETEGEAAIGSEVIGDLKAAAIATLTAVEASVDHRFTAHLADIDHVNALGKELVAVLVDVSFEGK